MELKSILLYAAFTSSLALAACSTTTQLMTPGPMAAFPDLGVTRAAILRGMALHSWYPDGEAPGQILARLNIRSHQARVLISYDPSRVSFQYVDSINLDYQVGRDGVAYIHRNYNTWVRNLAQAISQELSRGSVVVVAVPPGGGPLPYGGGPSYAAPPSYQNPPPAAGPPAY